MAALDKKESPQLGFLHPVSGARNDHDEVIGLGYLSLTSLNGNDLVSYRTGVVLPACACNHEAVEGVIWQG